MMANAEAAFSARMASFGPFESVPRLAVAVSSGADSMALCLLADRWARGRGGCVSALTVDHGLRPEAAAEAEQVGRWLKRWRIDHAVLRWRSERPKAGLQAAARAVRYRLLSAWCREQGVLHLLVGHHLDDQAETVVLRASRGSGIDGLAGMPAIRPVEGIRVLRPLLDVPGAALRAWLKEAGQSWLEDPSNGDPAFARNRVRGAWSTFVGENVTTEDIADAARTLGRLRAASEREAGAFIGRWCRVHPAGYAHIDGEALRRVPEPVARVTMARLLMAIGGRTYPPAPAALNRLLVALTGGAPRGRTLAQCRVDAWRGNWLVVREQRNLPEATSLQGKEPFTWDGRFRVQSHSDACSPFLAPLGESGWRAVVADRPDLRRCPLPSPARLVTPAIFAGDEVVDVPHLGYRRRAAEGLDDGPVAGGAWATIRFRPPIPLTHAGSFLA